MDPAVVSSTQMVKCYILTFYQVLPNLLIKICKTIWCIFETEQPLGFVQVDQPCLPKPRVQVLENPSL